MPIESQVKQYQAVNYTDINYSTLNQRIQLYKPSTYKAGFIDPSNSDYPMGKFFNQMGKFYYCPPSSNLWTVEIKGHSVNNRDATKSSLKTLYSMITTVNDAYAKVVHSDWGVDSSIPVKTSGLTMNEFINGFATVGNLFLAQSVKAPSNKITDNGNVFADFSQHGGFLTMPRVINSRQPGQLSCIINFNVGNWDLGDLIIDPWIAALAQRGLVKDGDIDLTAEIYLTHYAASAPNIDKNWNGVASEWVLRKQITLYGAFPIERGELIDVTYDNEKGGKYVTQSCTFHYDDYFTRYFV